MPTLRSLRLHAGGHVAEVMPYLLILSSLAFFLSPLMWAEKKAEHYKVVCPVCSADLTRLTRLVLATRCCNECKTQIVEGRRTRDPEVFERFSRLENRQFLIWLFWLWPCLGLFVLGWHWHFPRALQYSTHMLFVHGFIGIGMSGWAWFRTMDKGFIPQLVASALVFGLGVAAFWYVEFSA